MFKKPFFLAPCQAGEEEVNADEIDEVLRVAGGLSCAPKEVHGFQIIVLGCLASPGPHERPR
jgi:hypothetical protein